MSLWLVAMTRIVVWLRRCVCVARGRPEMLVVRAVVVETVEHRRARQGADVLRCRRVPMTCDEVTSLTVPATPPAVRMDPTCCWKISSRVFTLDSL